LRGEPFSEKLAGRFEASFGALGVFRDVLELPELIVEGQVEVLLELGGHLGARVERRAKRLVTRRREVESS